MTDIKDSVDGSAPMTCGVCRFFGCTGMGSECLHPRLLMPDAPLFVDPTDTPPAWCPAPSRPPCNACGCHGDRHFVISSGGSMGDTHVCVDCDCTEYCV